MSPRDGYDPGIPCWVDLSSTDPDASARFYERVLGWRAVVGPEAGGRGVFTHEGRRVAGLGPVTGEDRASSWNTFVATDDAAALADRVRRAGGTVVTEAAPISGHGSGDGVLTAFLAPDGSYTAAWQGAGAEAAGEPGAFCWHELVSRDTATAERFYAQVFGWSPVQQDIQGMKYTEWLAGGSAVAGMLEMVSGYPAETRSFWMTYFSVADPDATSAAAEEAGAQVLVPPMDAPLGRFSALVDPQGAAFSVIRLNEIS